MKSTGKKFEELIKLSADELGFDYTRLRDAGWQGEKTQRRFTVKNICDLIIFKSGFVFYIEAKSSKDRLALNRLTQHKDLITKKKKAINSNNDNLDCGYLLEINSSVFYVPVCHMDYIINSIGKKSLNETDLQHFKLGMILPKRKKKYRINLDELLG